MLFENVITYSQKILYEKIHIILKSIHVLLHSEYYNNTAL